MKKLNLDETWRLCLMMWKWIAKQKKAGNTSNVYLLKRTWLKKHGYKGNTVDGDCFFCEYTRQYSSNCYYCPPGKIEAGFRCDDKNCSYYDNPIFFYKKLLRLNKIRMAKKKVKKWF